MSDPVPDLHNTNPLAPARLTIQIVTHLGPHTVITSKLPRAIASALVDALAAKSILAAVTDDMGCHTVAELVKRKRAREARKIAPVPNNISTLQARKR